MCEHKRDFYFKNRSLEGDEYMSGAEYFRNEIITRLDRIIDLQEKNIKTSKMFAAYKVNRTKIPREEELMVIPRVGLL